MKFINLIPRVVTLVFAIQINAKAIEMEFVEVADGQGGVSYEYEIGKYEVTLDEYSAFLNAVGMPATFSGSGRRPVTVGWSDAVRFANWMHNGQPIGAPGPLTTERGAYDIYVVSGWPFFVENPAARYRLPTLAEWRKAAFYQPSESGGDIAWLYPTRSNDLPNSRNGSTTDPNSANFFRDDGVANGYNEGFAVPNPDVNGYLTDVGAFTLASSHYGTYDQGGNVWEWLNGPGIQSQWCVGGSWNSGHESLTGWAIIGGDEDWQPPSGEVGFRLVHFVEPLPEPSVNSLFIISMFVIRWGSRKRTAFG